LSPVIAALKPGFSEKPGFFFPALFQGRWQGFSTGRYSSTSRPEFIITHALLRLGCLRIISGPLNLGDVYHPDP
jgi:hypothetical protein